MTLCKCGEEYDLCCDGTIRCPNCDGPCLGCYDGPGPVVDDSLSDDEYEMDPDSGNIFTYDHCEFYQYGKVVLSLTPEDDHVAALRAFMDRERFWPSVYLISDHGNAILIEL